MDMSKKFIFCGERLAKIVGISAQIGDIYSSVGDFLAQNNEARSWLSASNFCEIDGDVWLKLWDSADEAMVPHEMVLRELADD